jgi:hypothetical protein
MKNITLELKLKVRYIPNGVPVETLKSNLESLVSIGVGDGLLTGETPAEVEVYYTSITEIPK